MTKSITTYVHRNYINIFTFGSQFKYNIYTFYTILWMFQGLWMYPILNNKTEQLKMRGKSTKKNIAFEVWKQKTSGDFCFLSRLTTWVRQHQTFSSSPSAHQLIFQTLSSLFGAFFLFINQKDWLVNFSPWKLTRNNSKGVRRPSDPPGIVMTLRPRAISHWN